MKKASFVISGDSAKHVAKAISVAADAGVRLFDFNADREDPVSLLDILHESALARLRSRLGDLRTFADRIAADDEDLTLLKVVEAAGIANPFRHFRPNGEGGFAMEGRSEPKGFHLPLRNDPAEIKLLIDRRFGAETRRLPNVAIEFVADGAPAQVNRAPGYHGITFLRRQECDRSIGYTGTKHANHTVHVYVVDQGMDEDHVNAMGGPGTYAGLVWNSTIPIPKEMPREHDERYRTRPQWHAHMIVRNILAVAGDNRDLPGPKRKILIYDVPVLPDQVYDVLTTALKINDQYLEIAARIAALPSTDRAVIVNAWGVKNRLHEEPLGYLTTDSTSPLNQAIQALAIPMTTGPNPVPLPNPRSAVVFAAGNTGLFATDPEAGPYDRGPGRSAWLPAALPGVWTAGACDANGMWIGSASQGPHSGMGEANQPGFALPSYFRETMDAHALNSGSSAACGVLAGMIAAHWRKNAGPPNRVNAGSKADKIGFTVRSNRLGRGVPQHLKID